MTVELRRATADDFARIEAVLGQWWGGRDVTALLQPLFLEHFASTSLVAEDGADLVGFLVGFVSADRAGEAYVHFVGVDPRRRRSGLGRVLHERFAEQVAAFGVRTVRCITSQENADSVRFHTSIGFTVDGHARGHVEMSRAVDVNQPRFVSLTDPRPNDAAFPTTAVDTWPIPGDTVLAGETVELTVADPERDAAELFAALDGGDVWAHVFGRPADPAGMRGLLEQRQATAEWCTWIVRLRRPLASLPAGAVVGTTSFLDVVPHEARGEIGATLYHRDVWGTSVNPECKLVLMSFAFDELGWGRIQLKTDVRNHRSQQAIARLGAVYEGTLSRFQRRTDNTMRDTVLFAVTVDRWPHIAATLRRRLAQHRPAPG